jgi:MscS family membrane protein
MREDLLLRIMDLIAAAGTGLAFPSRTLYMSRDSDVNPERTEAAQHQVEKWREENLLPFPDFSPEAISGMRASIEYPDGSSAIRKK